MRGPWPTTCLRFTVATFPEGDGLVGVVGLAGLPDRAGLAGVRPVVGTTDEVVAGSAATSSATCSGCRWALGLAAFLASANEKDRGTLRYMVPFVLSGAVLTARVIGGRARSAGAHRLGILGVLATAYAVTVAWDLEKPPAGDPAVGARGLAPGA